MIDELGEQRLREFMEALGRKSRGPGAVFITGGGTAVLRGWRATTVDIDIRMDPEPEGAFASIPTIKRALRVNVELASPQDFLPPLPGWRERSEHITREGNIDFYHYDYVSQALSKIERGHEKDLRDVRSMVAEELVSEAAIREQFEAIRADMIRYPSVDPDALHTKIGQFFGDNDG